MARNRWALLAVAGLGWAGPAPAHEWGTGEGPGTLVAVSIEVDGREAPLFPARDGSGRYYLEAREGARYSVGLANRTGARLGVVVTVDGLNVISGERAEGRGRMYVLDPWQETTIRGWRTSLRDVRRFTFVDEKLSYAARSGKANAKMGWIEIAVYREHRAWAEAIRRERPVPLPLEPDPVRSGEATAPPAARAEAPPPPKSDDAVASKQSGTVRSFPGTGWGQRAHDPVVLVDFDPEPSPSECLTLRYEYRSTLVALGLLPRPRGDRDRLRERERGEDGFAKPPLW